MTPGAHAAPAPAPSAAAIADPARGRALLAGALVAVAATIALAAVWPLARAPLPIELNINEAWIAYHLDALVGGARPLYPPATWLITNNYPPLGYLVLAAVAPLFADPIYAGRALSLAALLVVAGAMVAILRRLEVGRGAAVLAAAGWIGTMCRLFETHVAVNDPQMLAHALMTLGFLRFLDERRRGARWFLGAALLMVMAGFVKHNIVAMPVAAWLLLLHADRAAALRFGLALGGLAAAGLAVSTAAFGPDFIANLLSPRPWDPWRTLKALEDLHRVAIPFALWVGYLVRLRDGARGRVVNTLCVVALLESLVVRGAPEVHVNAGYDLVIALWLAFAAAWDRLGALPEARWMGLARLRGVIVLLLALRLALDSEFRSVRFIADPGFRAALADAVVRTRAAVAGVAAIPGPVFCDSTLVCWRAGKTFVVDPVNVALRIASGALPPDAVDRLVGAGALTWVPADPVAVMARQ